MRVVRQRCHGHHLALELRAHGFAFQLKFVRRQIMCHLQIQLYPTARQAIVCNRMLQRWAAMLTLSGRG
jgi:hypothetical protein